MSVSEEIGMGEGSMSDFITQHMQNILQPFAEHVDELHRAIDILEADLRSTTETANAGKAALATHAALLSGLRLDLDGTTLRGNAAQASLDQTIKEKALLEADHRESKARLSASEDKVRTLLASVEALQHCTSQLRLGLDEVTNAQGVADTSFLQDIYPALAQHKAGIASVTAAHAETAELLASTRSFAQAMDREQKAFNKTCERQFKESEEAVGHVSKTIADLTVNQQEIANRTATHGDHLRTTNSKVRPLIVRIEQVEGLFKGLGGQRNETIRDIAEMHERLNVQKTMIDKLVSRFGEDDPRKGRSIFDQLQKASEQLTKHSQQIDRIDTATRNTSKKLEEVDDRTLNQEIRNEDITHRTVKIEETLGVEHHTFDGMPTSPGGGFTPRATSMGLGLGGDGRHSMASPSMSRATRTTSHNIQLGNTTSLTAERNSKEWSMAQGQKAGMRRIDATASAVAKTHAKLEQAITEHSDTEERVKNLEDELSLTNDQVARLSASLDLKQEYWQGLSKGLRDVHKAVAVDGDMLPQKSNMASTLPALGKNQRLMSTSPDCFSTTM